MAQNFTKRLVLTAVLISLSIVLTRLLSIQFLTIRVGFGFLPLAFISIMFGPFWGAVAAAVADITGFFMFPPPAPFFPGFTLSAALTGFIYGVFMYNKKNIGDISLKRVILACGSVGLFVNFILNTFWLYLIVRDAVIPTIPVRALWAIVFTSISITVINSLKSAVNRFF